ncbi:MAG: glycosyltransferase family 4 protein [Desulfovibrio sp.]|nr:glycosyltransferase family 4 protein [Desulfovibrio sp.]
MNHSERIFGSLHPFLETGPVLGRIVANEGFFKALLSLDPFDSYVFFLHNPKALDSSLSSYDLPAIRRGSVFVHPQQDLIPALQDTKFYCFHLADPLCDQTSLAFVRNRLSKTLFPITSVPHSLSYHVYVQDFLQEIWAGTSPRDVICATSHAAIDVLTCYYESLKKNYQLPETWQEPALRLLPLGVDVDRFSPPSPTERETMRNTLGLRTEQVVLLAHGRITVDDKMDLLPLLYAIKRVVTEPSPPQILLMVSGKIRENDSYPRVIEASAKALGIELRLFPDPDAKTLETLYGAADIFVSPSDNLQETFGLTILEAQSMGLPVIASDWDGYRDLVVQNETGFLIPTYAPEQTPYLDVLGQILPENIHQLLRAQETVVDVKAMANALSTLSKDIALRRRMGKKGRVHMCEHYSWQQCVERWLSLIEELWAIPISSEEENRLRTAPHPSFLSFATLFAQHPKHRAGDAFLTRRLKLSEHGRNVLRKKEVAVTWNSLDLLMHGINVEKLLTLSRNSICIASLMQRMAEKSLSDEQLLFAILWALKHDLLEFDAL